MENAHLLQPTAPMMLKMLMVTVFLLPANRMPKLDRMTVLRMLMETASLLPNAQMI